MLPARTVSDWLSRTDRPSEWLTPKLSGLSNHTLIKDRDVAISRLATAIRKGESICAFGDFDCDGMTSTVILVEAIRMMGGRITPIIANRYDGGYGFSEEALAKVVAGKFQLLITLDCGSSDHDRLERLQCDAVIVDHHLVPDRPFPKQVVAFLNPHREDCPSTYKWLASCGLAWSVIRGLIQEMGMTESIDHKQWWDVLAIGTVADVAPLDGDNRTLVRHGFDVISKAQRPGLRALLEISKITPGSAIAARDIGFKIAPGFNAPGRLGPADIVVRLLLERDLAEARKIAAEVKDLWDKRRLITDVVTDEAIQQIEENNWGSEPSIACGHPDWNHGVVGISAARLVDKYKVPVACFGHGGRGSLRGPQGSKLHSALSHCKGHLTKWGGHEAAAGAQLSWDQLDAFRSSFREFHEQNPFTPINSEENLFLDLDLRDSLEQVEKDLYLLEPTGQGNPKPRIRVTGILKSGKEVKGSHGKFDLVMENRKTLPCFIISRGPEIPGWIGKRMSVVGDLRKNEWRGKTTIELFVEEVALLA